MGASIAHHLAERGGAKILLAEKSRLAWGATGKSTAIVRQHYSNAMTAKMALDSLRFFQRFESTLGESSGFVRTGFMLAVGPADVEALKVNVAMQQKIGIRTQVLSPEEAKELQPNANVGDLGAVAFEEESGYADPVRTTLGFAKAAERAGVKVLENTPVEKLARSDGGFTANIGQDKITADKVVLATNAWTNEVTHSIGLKLPIRVLREDNCQFLRPGEFREPIPVWGDFVSGIYMRPQGGERVVVGSLKSDLPIIEGHVEYSDAVSKKTVLSYSEGLCKRYPVMANGLYERGWAGPYDVTPDWHPILDEAAGMPGLYLAVGFSGHGFKLCPSVGAMMAEYISTGRKPHGMELFRASRFEEGALVRTSYEYSIIA